MAGSRPKRMSYMRALTGMCGMIVPDRKSSPVTGQSNVAKVQPKVGDAIFVWDMKWGKAGWHEGKVMAILPKLFTVLFTDGDEFGISKKPTAKVCWTLDKTESVDPKRLEAMAKLLARKKEKEDKAAKKAKKKADDAAAKNSTLKKRSSKGSKPRKQKIKPKKRSTPEDSNSDRSKKKTKKPKHASKQPHRRKTVVPVRLPFTPYLCTHCMRCCQCPKYVK